MIETEHDGDFRDRLRHLMAEHGLSARALSKAIGANVTYVAQLLNGRGGNPSSDKLRELAAALRTTTDYLVGRTDLAAQPISEVSFRDVPNGWRDRNASGGIPLLGTGYCDDMIITEDGKQFEIERIQLELDHTVRMIERPAALWAARDAYAIYFHGASMEPRFFQGEVGIVDPRRPPGPGDFVVVQLSDGASDHVVTVLVKQLVRQNSSFVELAQFNPGLTFQVPRSKVARMHRIVPTGELLF